MPSFLLIPLGTFVVDEDITEEESLMELLRKEADAAIFKSLGLNFGKVVKLKREFKSLLEHESATNKKKGSHQWLT